MRLVKDIHHLNKLINEVKEKSQIVTTNFFLLPNRINDYIYERRLYFNDDPNSLIFFCEEADFFYLYFFLVDSENQENFSWLNHLQKPVIIDLISNEKSKSPILDSVENYWISNGFKHFRLNRRMAADRTSIKTDANRDNKHSGDPYHVHYAKKIDAPEVLKLWRNNLDRYTAPFPNLDDLAILIENSQVIGGYNMDNQLAAALQFSQIHHLSTIEYLAVNPDYRRKGFAQLLLNFYFSNSDNIRKFYLWVNDINKPAIRLYENNGYYFDGKINRQLRYP